ncbi:MAG: AAA family ATPase [Pseudomonadales bacterium]
MNFQTRPQIDPANPSPAAPSVANKFAFGPYRLDCANAQLYHAEQALALTPKAFAVLTELVQSPGCLVTKDTLFDTVWSGTIVSEAALTVCIREIRKVLDDSPRTPQYIATVHKRGYRFIANVEHIGKELDDDNLSLYASADIDNKMIGREVEAARLCAAMKHATQGQRQCVLVTGEAGLGKTTLVEACLQQFDHVQDVRIARGQCVEHHGHVEPYLPWLDAMTRLCLQDQEALNVFRRFAPMWLLQTPALLNTDEQDKFEGKLVGANPERMMREMLEALVALAAQRPLIIYLDDLHFSDTASVELLACLARRPDISSLLVIGCYRPVDLIVKNHALKAIKQELEVRGLCVEIPLELFSTHHVAAYIDARLPCNALPEDLATAIHARTDGNPLFTLNVIEYLHKRKWLEEIDGRWTLACDLETVKTCVPESLVQMLGYHIEQLQAEVQSVLQAAAVASDVGKGNVQFSTAEVAAALEKDSGWVEEHCDQLAQQGHFLRSVATNRWPDCTLLVRYEFTHGLYQKAFYRRVTAGKRAALHQRIGERMAHAFNARDNEIAAELAVHFEQGRDFARAARYLQKSAATASQRGVTSEAKNDLTQALELAVQLPEGLSRARLEMQLHTAMGTVLVAEKGNADPEVERSYKRARELCELAGDAASMFPIVFGLRSCSLLAGRLQEAHGLGQDLLKLAENVDDADLTAEAQVALASTAFFLGQFKQSLAHASSGIDIYSAERHAFHITHYGLDPGVFCRCRAAQALWSLGYPEQALRRVQEALTLALQLAHPYSLVFALNNHAWICMFRREAESALEHATQALQLANEHYLPFHAAWGQIMRGWALTAQGESAAGLALIQEGLAAPMSGADGVRSYLLTVLADAYCKAGDCAPGLAALDEIAVGAEHFLEAERYYLRGKLLLIRETAAATNKQDTTHVFAAEECFNKALECARSQHAKSFELRAAISLAGLWTRHGRAKQAQELLAPLIAWFDEGHATLDLVEASAMLGRAENNTVRVTEDSIVDP